jgi:hypothetical protein
MKIFHIFAVIPETPRNAICNLVRYHDFYVVGPSLMQAYDEIRGYSTSLNPLGIHDKEKAYTVESAPEVWGCEFDRIVVIKPSSRHNETLSYADHIHWAKEVESYKRISSGDFSLQEAFNDLLKEHQVFSKTNDVSYAHA